VETILLIGAPNSGKSTLFNLLSGKHRKVSNYSGVTVDNAIGELLSNDNNSLKISLVDLPGINGLNPKSLDEGVTIRALLGLEKRISKYNQVAVVLDIHRLEASLALALQLRDILGNRVVLIINKVDRAQLFERNRVQEFEQLIGMRVFICSALKDSYLKIDEFLRSNIVSGDFEFNRAVRFTNKSREYLGSLPPDLKLEFYDDDAEAKLLEDIEEYHKKARVMISGFINLERNRASRLTKKMDGVLLHPLWGSLCFFAIFYLIFHSIYVWAVPFMDLIDGGVSAISGIAASSLPDGLLKSLLVDGIFAGVGGVIVFLPQIMILFFLLSLLELSGYIGRAAFLTDRVMGFFGLNGKAFLPYMSGLACAVPAIMSARTIPNRLERIVTIMTIPMMTCSARLPVYILLIGAFVPKKLIWGFFDSQALSFFFLYFLGAFFALVMAKFFRMSFFKGKGSSFFLDLPLYQMPSLKLAFKNSWRQGKIFLRKAGTIILGFSILLWVLSTFPRVTDEMVKGKSSDEVASISLEHSMVGKLGKAMEPALRPIGMNWKMGIGLLVAFGARELFVSALGTIYSLGNVDEQSEGLRQRMIKDVDPVTGRPVFNLAVAWSILIFFVFALQCTSTLAIVHKETGNWLYPTGMFLYMGTLGYLGAFLAFHFLS